MSYLDHLRGMQSQFDEARDQAQSNINAVNQNAYVRAEAKKNDYLAQVARHYEDIQNKLETGAAVAGGVGALVKHGKLLHATLTKKRVDEEAKKPESDGPDLEKPGSATQTPQEPTDGPQTRAQPNDDARPGDIETPREGGRLDTDVPELDLTGEPQLITIGDEPTDPSPYDSTARKQLADESREKLDAPELPEGDDPSSQVLRQFRITTNPDLTEGPGAPSGKSVFLKPGETLPGGAGAKPTQVPQGQAPAPGEVTQGGTPAAGGDLETAGPARAGKGPLFDLGEGPVAAHDLDPVHDAPGAAQRIADEDIGPIQRTEAPLGGGEGPSPGTAPGKRILGPNLDTKAPTPLEKADPDGSISDMMKKGATEATEKMGGGIAGDILGDLGLTALDSIPIIGDIAMAAQMIGGAVMGGEGEDKEKKALNDLSAQQDKQPIATGVATQGLDIKSIQ